MNNESLSSRCYSLLSAVPPGKVTTYKLLAEALGTKAYRAIGRIMNKNPHAPVVPCHRVVNSNGKLGGYAFGLEKKIALLNAEGVRTKDGLIDNFDKVLFHFPANCSK
jgi:methylated-DNA-[protein]-cysteine S-methyltransferase